MTYIGLPGAIGTIAGFFITFSRKILPRPGWEAGMIVSLISIIWFGIYAFFTGLATGERSDFLRRILNAKEQMNMGPRFFLANVGATVVGLVAIALGFFVKEKGSETGANVLI
ncbi:MAG: hypothetical protein IJM30_09990 [Thermoguttaceae bacterium]|nr:hypothetical protein [Thermoguttaceae bacterium]